MKRTLVGMVLVVMLSGCATGPYTPIKSANLDGAKMVYWEQSDRIPKEVMLEAWRHQPVAPSNLAINAAVSLTPDQIAEIIKEIMAAVAVVMQGYQNERMNEALLSRRMLFRGYGTNELADINDIVKSMGWAIEYMTPQGKPYPPAAVPASMGK